MVLLPVFAAPRLISGPLHSGIARERAPTTVRAMWGTDGTSNAIHVSVDMESADKERLHAVYRPTLSGTYSLFQMQ